MILQVAPEIQPTKLNVMYDKSILDILPIRRQNNRYELLSAEAESFENKTSPEPVSELNLNFLTVKASNFTRKRI